MVLSAVLSCAQESFDELGPEKGTEMTFYASFEEDSSEPAPAAESTKTMLATGTGAMTWTRNDRIGILNSDNLFDIFTLSGNGGSAEGEFTGTLSPGTTPQDIAVYPVGLHYCDGETLTVNLPSVYGSRSAAYSPSTNAIMKADVEGNNLVFKHLGGLVCFTVKNLPKGTYEVSLTGSGICGDFEVVDGVIAKADDAEDCTQSYVFSPLAASGSKAFYFPLPTGSYEKFTLNIIGDNAVRTATISFDGAKSLDRRDFVKFPDLDAATLSVTNMDISPFNLLNLDYPGLENVKAEYHAGKYKQAAAELLTYYRNRTTVENISAVEVTSVTAAARNRANQATREGGFRFYVKNYVEDNKGTSDEKDDVFYSFLASDGSIDWAMTPAALAGQQEWKQRYRLQWMLPQAKVYAYTKDEKYVVAWKEILTSLMTVCDNYKVDGEYVTYDKPNLEPYNVAWAALQTTARLEDMLTVFEYYKTSENFTPEWLMTYLGYIYDHVRSMQANPYGGNGYSNITTAQHTCKAYAGLYMPEFKDASKWLAEGASGLSEDVHFQFNEDGVLCEYDYGYHVGTLGNYIAVYNAVQQNIVHNPHLADVFTDYTSALRNAANFVQDYIYPDYTAEGMSDTRPSSVSKSATIRNLETYNSMFPDGHFEYMSTESHSSGIAPSTDVSIYPVSGYYMFRTGWDKDDMVLIHKNANDPDERTHNQWDNGTISLYRNGRRFMPDAGVPSYGGDKGYLDGLRSDYEASAKHSTVTLNGANHIKRAGTFLGGGQATDYEYVATENEIASNLKHRRTIFFVKKSFFVIVDDVYGSGTGNVTMNMMLGDGNYDSKYTYSGNGAVPFMAFSKYTDGNNMYYKTFISDADKFKSASKFTDYYVNDVITSQAEYESERIERAAYQVTVNKPDAASVSSFITVIHPIGTTSEGSSMDVDAVFGDYRTNSSAPDPVSVTVTVNGTTYSCLADKSVESPGEGITEGTYTWREL